MSKREEVLIIEVLSSGAMYIEEVIDRGYKALVVNPDCADKHMTEGKEAIIKPFVEKYDNDKFELIQTPNSCDAIVKAVEGHNIVAVVVGSEYGVRVTDKVANALDKP